MPYNTIGAIGSPLFAPGSNWSYTNTNYVIAGAILEGLTADPFLAFSFRHRFFEKLNGADIFLLGPESVDLSRLATSWRGNGENQMNWSQLSFYSSYWTAGAIVSTASNIADWMYLLLGTDDILNEPARAKMTNFRTIPNQIPTADGVDKYVDGFIWNSYGLGLMRFLVTVPAQNKEVVLWGYWGATAGFNDLAAYIVDADVTVMISVNRRGNEAEANCLKILRDFTRHILAFTNRQ